jgi:hypothetical protein
MNSMGLWCITTWNILNDQIIEHEKIAGQLLHSLRQSYPSKHFRYFRRRFGPFTGRIMITGDFNNMMEWEHWMNDMQKQHGSLMELWRSCIDQSSHEEYYWKEITVE